MLQWMATTKTLPLSNMEILHMSICYNGWLQQQHYLDQIWGISPCATMDGYKKKLPLSNMEILHMSICYNGLLQHYLYQTWRISICPYATMDGFNSNITFIRYGESPHMLQWMATTTASTDGYILARFHISVLMLYIPKTANKIKDFSLT